MINPPPARVPGSWAGCLSTEHLEKGLAFHIEVKGSLDFVFCTVMVNTNELFGGGLVDKSCLAVCNPMNCSLPVSSVYGVLQARILEWLPFPSPGDLPDTGIEPGSPALQADSLPTELQGKLLMTYL